MGYRLKIRVPADPAESMQDREAAAIETAQARMLAMGNPAPGAGVIVARETFTQDEVDLVELTIDMGEPAE